MAGETVLVTGGSGFVAGWCIERLLKAGYTVNATVRSLSKEAATRATIAAWAPEAADPARLRFFAADLTADAGWAEATAGCTYVLHVASPLAAQGRVTDETYLTPARDGTLRVLKAAVSAGVKRVVITSSMAAIAYGHPKARYTNGKPFDGSEWSDPNSAEASPYARSKILAERAAWDFMAANGGATELAVVNPSGILGPPMGHDYSPSLGIVVRMMTGRMPGLPRIGFSVVDVRDLADLHLLAMTKPEAAGNRYAAGGQFYWFADIARILRQRLPELSAKVPTRNLPDWLLRLIALRDPQVRQLTPQLGKSRDTDPSAAIALGWSPRTAEDCIIDTAKGLKAFGAV